MRLIVFLLITIAMACSAQAQNYLNPTCQWSERTVSAGMSETQVSNYIYYINGDTAIGGHMYYKLFRQGVDTFYVSGGAVSSVNQYNAYRAALREANGRFYVVDVNAASEHLEVSFNWNDLFTHVPMYGHWNCTSPSNPPVVLDTVHLGTTPLLRYNLGGVSNPLIEGIGPAGGLLNGGCVGFHTNTKLLCFSKDNNRVVLDSSAPCRSSTAPGGPDCQARFCYTATDSAGLMVVRFYNQSAAHVYGDSIIHSYLSFGDGNQTSNWTSAPLTYYYSIPGTFAPVARIETRAGCTSTFSMTLQPGSTCATVVIPGAPPCQASYCYTASELNGQMLVYFHNTSTTNLVGDSIAPYANYFWNASAPPRPVPANFFDQFPLTGISEPRIVVTTALGCVSSYADTIRLGSTCRTTAASNIVIPVREFKVFPTQATDRFTVTYEGPHPGARLLLFDLQGRQLLEKPLLSASTVVARNGLATGWYLYRIWWKGRSSSGKVYFQ
ncbi:MAG: T9SS type A sorting domain-containing protein [Sphingobacteriales bacterium]|nr:MAG: T9SS type A sorting domain-containing protein [Sphingobacteriales bacterium]